MMTRLFAEDREEPEPIRLKTLRLVRVEKRNKTLSFTIITPGSQKRGKERVREMNSRRLILSGSWLVRKFCTATSENATAAAVEVAAPTRNRLYSRLSALGATGGTVSEVLNDIIMEGKKIWKDELSRCVKELRKYRRYQHCLDIMDWMEKRNMQFSHVDHAIRLDLIAKTKGLGAAKDYLSALPPGAKNRLTYGALLNCYCNNLMKDEALTLFKKMDEVKLIKSALPFNNLMCLYMRLGQPEKVPELIDELKQRNIPRCRFTYIFWMQSYANLNDIEGVERVLEELSNDSEDKCTWTTYSNLAAIYVKAGQFEKAEACLKKLEKDKMPRQREAYHFLISLYAGTSNLAEVYRVWEALKRAYSTVTNLSYLIIVQALANLKDFEGLKKCFEEWESNYSVYDMRLATSTIRGYLSGDMHKEAELVLDNAMKRSKGPFTRARECFMVYFLKKRRFDLALRHMEAAVSEINDWSPSNPETTTAFFDYFMNKGDVDAAEEFCKILKNNNCLDSDAYHWLLRTYVAAGKVAPDMRKRLENDGIELSQDLQNLLVNVCPEKLQRKFCIHRPKTCYENEHHDIGLGVQNMRVDHSQKLQAPFRFLYWTEHAV
ncbi:pentatricopeptide repeat-containing protein At1g02370, mitochondrial [Durio zibethinus]|uniref:Pentatricopeptide repeat-containing protein At1g02370, mitochondrial n=1 Tax=Durio zibethinus TaxID=66656 RepID=A0A6P6AXB8_DURZI|nr:pentatricopeptide repeat-containing protein At1g02370, mitochondrial [Durio zibethinus]